MNIKIPKAYNNDNLLTALKDRDDIFKSMIEENDFDDEQLKQLNKYLSLSQFHRDLLYLTSIMKIKDICELYAVSHTHIYNQIKKIKTILK
jgi:uncharacterized protein YjcR